MLKSPERPEEDRFGVVLLPLPMEEKLSFPLGAQFFSPTPGSQDSGDFVDDLFARFLPADRLLARRIALEN